MYNDTYSSVEIYLLSLLTVDVMFLPYHLISLYRKGTLERSGKELKIWPWRLAITMEVCELSDLVSLKFSDSYVSSWI